MRFSAPLADRPKPGRHMSLNVCIAVSRLPTLIVFNNGNGAVAVAWQDGWLGAPRSVHLSMDARIAIIDDDADVRESTRQLLRSRGYLTVGFASAEDFLKSGEVIQASCVITDVRMPGMSGVALQAWLKAQGSNIPMIFVTAFPEPKIQEQVLAAGARAYLAKPYQAASLINCIEAVLQH